MAAVLAASGLVVAGCQGASGSTGAPASSPSSASPSSSRAAVSSAPARITVSPADGTRGVRPDRAVVVRAGRGVLTLVQVRGDDGHLVHGAQAEDGSWRSTEPLRPATSYVVTSRARNAAGRTTTERAALRTLTPLRTASYSLLPGDGSTVGVGMPVIVRFDRPVRHRAAVERRLHVATAPLTRGSWGWLDSTQVAWRPARFWQPGTKVTVAAQLAGTETTDGRWATRDARVAFRTGQAMVSTVDVQAHTLTVRRNGALERVIPVTTGKPGFETRRGTKVIISRESSRHMDAETTGLAKTDPNYYQVDVRYAMRLTWTGEFLHAAPWSEGSQGRANVSHGCTGMSTSNARWMFEHSRMGDVVRFVGSRRPLEEENGYTMWNPTYQQWQARSALS